MSSSIVTISKVENVRQVAITHVAITHVAITHVAITHVANKMITIVGIC